MLQRLHIRNYAIIDELNIDFHPQFNIITGETGAGKSILVGALGLVLGNRADTAVLRNVATKCLVEAIFQLPENENISQLLARFELDESEDLIIRREITPNGKSRSFINDTPVTLQALRQFAAQLVDLHQQFDTLELGENDFQRSVIDALANHSALLLQYKLSFEKYQAKANLLKHLQAQKTEADKAADYNKYLYSELEEAGLQPNELELLDDELDLLTHAESIKAVLQLASYNLQHGEQPLVQQIKSISLQLQSLHSPHAGIENCIQRIQSAQLELQDIANEIEHINDGISLNPERLQVVNDRIAMGYKLMKKHNVTTTDALLKIQDELSIKLQDVLNLDAEISTAEKACKKLETDTMAFAKTMSANRRKILPDFEKNTASLLLQVGMPNAKLKVELQTGSVPTSDGIDRISFLFDANKTGRFEPLEKVASGGELSRLMLSIKSLVAKSMQLPTLIFDEIDTGISGEAARQVGQIMKGLSTHHQLISITHQPQIAAKANAHFYVYKKEAEGQINTRVRLLENNDRIEAIAAMLSGEQHTESSKKMAREMIEG